MKKFVLFLLIFLSATVWAKEKAPISAYTVTVEVTGSHVVVLDRGFLNKVCATIDGAKYELQSIANGYVMLKPGKYQARVTRTSKTAFEIDSGYEFLLPDGSRRNFDVIGVGDVAKAGM